MGRQCRSPTNKGLAPGPTLGVGMVGQVVICASVSS